ncbi:MAG: M48 family metallopeptidase [Planctomycetota bacterium]
MDFFQHQEKARRSTGYLVTLFLLAVIGICAAIYFLACIAFYFGDVGGRSWWQPEVFMWAALATLAVVGLGMFYKIHQLSQGGSAVARLMGGRLIPPSTNDRDERRLRNVVEEMAIASGLPVPALFVMDDEPGINAFAAGYTAGDAAVAVTRGCLDQFNRDELQGVIAHEFSHVLNGDMRLNIRLMGLLNGILCIGIAGYIILRAGGRSRGRGAIGFVMFGVGLLAVGYLGVFFAKMIKAAVSRQREFLADASAVQFTRNPDGIGNALKKIGGFHKKGRLESAHAEEASHMFFANALSSGFSSLFATHPPIVKRIKAIDPHFRPEKKFTDQLRGVEAAAAAAGGMAGGEMAAGEMAAGLAAGATMPAGATMSADATVGSIGEPTAEHVIYSRRLLKQIPPNVSAAVRDAFSARAVIYCLLLSTDGSVRREQMRQLQSTADPQTLQETMFLSSNMRALDPRLRLPLIDLSLPALRGMSYEQFQVFRTNVMLLTSTDNKMDLFEFTLEKVLLRHLDSAFVRVKLPPARFHTLKPILHDCATVLSVLTHAGHSDPDAAAKAFRDGTKRLAHKGVVPQLQITPRNECRLSVLHQALDRLVEATPECKRKILTACAHAAASDGQLRPAEAELLRAVADTMDCPMPPVPLGVGKPTAVPTGSN